MRCTCVVVILSLSAKLNKEGICELCHYHCKMSLAANVMQTTPSWLLWSLQHCNEIQDPSASQHIQVVVSDKILRSIETEVVSPEMLPWVLQGWGFLKQLSFS